MCMNPDVEDVADDLARKTDLALQNGHIIKIDNSFNKTHAFNRLTGSEQNIAWAIISMFSTDDTAPDHSSVRTRLTVDSTEIRNLAGIGSQGSRVTIADYKKFLDKLRTFFLTQFFVVHIKEGDVLVERGSPVFKYFDIRNGGDQICIELMPASAHLFSKILMVLVLPFLLFRKWLIYHLLRQRLCIACSSMGGIFTAGMQHMKN